MASRRKRSQFSAADLRVLLALKRKTDRLYRNFWVGALGTKPPRPPKVEPFLSQFGTVIDYIARSLPPPRPSN